MKDRQERDGDKESISYYIGNRGGGVISKPASHQGEPGSSPGWVTGFSQVGIVPDDAVGRLVFSGISRFPQPLHSGVAPYSLQSPSSALKTSLLRAAQISSLTHSSYGGGKREIPEETCTPGTILTCENHGATPLGIEPGSPWWEAISLVARRSPTIMETLTSVALNLLRGELHQIQLPLAVIGDPSRTPLFLERYARGCLPSWESRECRQRRDFLASQTSSRLLEFPIRLATTQECSCETG
ncbi:hypothetical protein PR048_004361 [Dryococelus australis]|uniref:Uncharacterized protein n=1 Tax=Dryococelus australis TaxID=614101 RepID=A0ABQ9I583_9NEOP|nr:hypothetical protein PR048_004361 [Dryococelus australis]